MPFQKRDQKIIRLIVQTEPIFYILLFKYNYFARDNIDLLNVTLLSGHVEFIRKRENMDLFVLNHRINNLTLIVIKKFFLKKLEE